MLVAEKTIKQSNILPKDWKTSTGKFTADELISAYLNGKKEGAKEELQNRQQEFSLNVKLATSIAEELLALGIEGNLNLNTIYLKAININSFEALFLIDKESFLADKFRDAYVISRNLRNKYNNDRFNMSFSFTAETEELSVECIASDGFFMKYEKRKTA